MRGKDIPQANNLDRVRDVVRAVESGARAPAAIERLTKLSVRHAGYYLQAARILGLVSHEGDAWLITDSGRRLVATVPDSAAEAMVLRQVIRDSAILGEIAPDLLDEERPPALEKLTVGIMEAAGLSLATATRRALTLLAWRERVLSPMQPTLFDDAAPASPRDAPPS